MRIEFLRHVPKDNSYRFYRILIDASVDPVGTYRVESGRSGSSLKRLTHEFSDEAQMRDDLLRRIRDRISHGYAFKSFAGPDDVKHFIEGLYRKSSRPKVGATSPEQTFLRMDHLRAFFGDFTHDRDLDDAIETLRGHFDPASARRNVRNRKARPALARGQQTLPGLCPDQDVKTFLDQADPVENAAAVVVARLSDILLARNPRVLRAVRAALSAPKHPHGDNVVLLRARRSRGAEESSLLGLLSAEPELLPIAYRLSDHGVRTVGQLTALDLGALQRMTSATAQQLKRIDRLCGRFQLQLGLGQA